MAQTYSLALYSVTIHRLGNRNDRLVLTDFDNGKSLYDIAYDMLCSIKYKKEIEQEKANLSQKNDITEKRFFRIMKDDNGDILKDRRPYLTGFIESGEYGTEENIVNVETGETKEKKEKDALDITPSKLSDGNIDDSEVNNMQLTLNAPRNGSINILSWFNDMRVRFEQLKNKKRTNICSLSDVEYQNVKFEVEIGGASRTISMQDVGKLGTYLDITNEITLDKNHYPTFASVDQQANIIISDIKQQWENNQ